jgi:hypothetical protein
MLPKIFKTFSASLIVILTSIFPFRFFANESMFGEPFDTKAQLSFHEHWLDFLLGNRSFLDAGFFYPYQTSFALSDIFIISGPIHALFRIFDLDIIDSLKLATLVVIIIGNIGWLLLSTKIISNRFIQLLFVFTIGTSYTFIGHVYLKPNMAAYGLISWFILNVVLLSRFRSRSIIKNTNSIGAIIFIPILLALNVWYVSYFIILVAVVIAIIFLILSIILKKFNLIKKLIMNFTVRINIGVLIGWIIASLALVVLFLKVYLPELKNGYGDANRDLFLAYSPDGLKFFDSTGAGGGITSILTSRFIESSLVSAEMNLGLNLIIFFLICLIFILQLFQYSKSNNLLNIFNISVLAAMILISTSTIKYTQDNSLFVLLWDAFSPLRTMRFPIRFNIVFNFIALIFIFVYIDYYINSKKQIYRFLGIAFAFLLLLDMQRNPFIYWDKSDLINENLLEYSDQISECNSFVVQREGVGWWKDSIDGMTLSALVKIPTVNGFSSIYPTGYPSFDYSESATLKPIIEWLAKEDNLSKSCLISHGPEIIKLDQKTISWFPQQGFTGKEYNKDFTWSWMVFPQGKIMILNSTNSAKDVEISFKIKSAPCNIGRSLSFKSSNEEVTSKVLLSANPIPVYFNTTIEQYDSLEIDFITDGASCKAGSDPRNLYLSVNDLKLN